MVARPGPISLPLLAGQNQKVDPRLQSPQEFASVVNVEMTRDGRQAARHGFQSYAVGVTAGQTATSLGPIRCVGSGDMFVSDAGDLPYWAYAYRAYVRSRASGGSQDTGYSTAPMKSVAYGGVPTLIPERVIAASNYRGESEQTSTTVYVSDRSEWVVSANCDTGNINIVWRSRDTLEVVATQRVKSSDFGDPSGGENYIQCSVVCSQQFNHTLVVAVRLDGEIDYIYCSDAGVTPTVTSSGLTVSMAANVNSNIDLASFPGGNNAVLIYNDGANVNVRMVGIAPPHATHWTTTVFSPPTQYTRCALDPTPGIELLWSVASSDPFGVTRTLRMGVLNFGSGAAIATSGASTTPSPWIPGIPFCSHDDNVGGQGVHFLATTTINASTFEPISRLYVWDKV